MALPQIQPGSGGKEPGTQAGARPPATPVLRLGHGLSSASRLLRPTAGGQETSLREGPLLGSSPDLEAAGGVGRSPGQTHRQEPLPSQPSQGSAQTGPLMRTSRLNNQYLKPRARQGECKALLVNICLDWQSQPLPPQPPASLLAPLCLHSSQPTAQRDAPGEAGDRLAATRGCTGRWARPVPRPLCQQPSTPGSPGATHLSPWATAQRLAGRCLWIPSKRLFPGGTPDLCLSYFGRKQSQGQNPRGVLENRGPPSPMAQDGTPLPVPMAAHGGTHTGPPGLLLGATEAWRVPSLEKPSMTVGGCTHQLRCLP